MLPLHIAARHGPAHQVLSVTLSDAGVAESSKWPHMTGAQR